MSDQSEHVQAANKTLVRRFFETVLSAGELTALDELIATDYVGHDPNLPPLPPGPEGVSLFTLGARVAFPDQRVTIQDLLAEGDRVAVRFTLEGTHRGDLLDLPPTGRHVSVQGVALYRIAGGKIAEGWIGLDGIGLLDQLGLFERLGALAGAPTGPPVAAAPTVAAAHMGDEE
jgi:predicted SnoaL-like aldol condensation-catalyzing enzyme